MKNSLLDLEIFFAVLKGIELKEEKTKLKSLRNQLLYPKRI